MPSNVFNEMCVKITAKIYYEKSNGVCNAVYFRLCIDLMHNIPPVQPRDRDMMAPITQGVPNAFVGQQ